MSLATRCTSCGTMFRVVQDQLRVSEGWVRCGRCDTVFQAHDALMDLVEPPAAATEAPPTSSAAFIARRSEPSLVLEDDAGGRGSTRPSPEDTDFPATEWAGTQSPTLDAGDITALPGEPTLARASIPSNAARDTTSAAPAVPPVADRDAPQPDAAAEPPAPATKPGFVRQAERRDRWQSPAARAAMVFAGLLLSLLLAGQVAFHHRDGLAARSALAKRVLTEVCARWACTVQAPRTLRDVTLEGSGLARVAQDGQAVRLTVNLRNRGGIDLAAPSIDLSLTDANGQLIARRALSPADFRIDPPVIERQSERQLELTLSTGDQGVTGYTVELFYP